MAASPSPTADSIGRGGGGGARTAALLLLLRLLLRSCALADECPSSCSCHITLLDYMSVNCSRGELRAVPSRLPATASTTILDLRANDIRALGPDSLAHFDQLQVLYLNHNDLETIASVTFQKLRMLQTLHLSHNKIRHLEPRVFEMNTNLEMLDVSNNLQLHIIPKEPFLISNSIKILDLGSTNIDELYPITFSRLQNIKVLQLTNNNLRTVPVTIIELFKNLTEITLMGNPLTCDCKMKASWQWIEERKVKVDENILCNQPNDWKNQPWKRVISLSCSSEPTDLTPYVLFAIIFVLIIIAVLVALLVCRHKHRTTRQLRAPKSRFLGPVGEYIDVLPEKPPTPHMYERVGYGKKEPDIPKPEEPERYVKDISRAQSYLAPVEVLETGPLYVNMKGPPLPVRRPSKEAAELNLVPPTEPAPAPPDTHLTRPCSIPLLENCDFYEAID